MLPELVGFCRQTVTIAPRTSVDSYGEPTYGTAVTYRARVVGRRRLVRNAQGEEVLSSHTVYLATNPVIGPHDKLTLSTSDAQSTDTGALSPPILAAGRFPDDLGRQSTIVFLA